MCNLINAPFFRNSASKKGTEFLAVKLIKFVFCRTIPALFRPNGMQKHTMN